MGGFQKMENFWKEYDTLLNEAKTALGTYKIAHAVQQTAVLPSPAKPTGKKPKNPQKQVAKPPAVLSFKGNFSHTLQLPQNLQKQAIDTFKKEFVQRHIFAFVVGILPYVGVLSALELKIDWADSLLLYLGGWVAIAGIKLVAKKKKIQACYEVETDQITKRTSFGKRTIAYKDIEEAEVKTTDLVVRIKNPNSGVLIPAMYISADIEHYKELKQHL